MPIDSLGWWCLGDLNAESGDSVITPLGDRYAVLDEKRLKCERYKSL